MGFIKQAFEAKGYDQLDLLEVSSAAQSYTYDPGLGYQITSSDDFGIGVRAIVKGKVGHAYANRYGELQSAVKKAIKFAKYSDIYLNLTCFGPYKKPKKIYDKKLVETPHATFLDQLTGIISNSNSEKCNLLEANNSSGSCEVRYINSEGVDISEKSTAFGVSWAVENKKNFCNYGVESTSFSKDIAKDVVRTCELAKLQNKKISVKTETLPVVFHHLVFPNILTYGFVPAISAKTIQQGKSKLAGKLGQKLFSDKITMIDDGLLSGGLGSGSFDGEGVPMQTTKVIEKGVMKNFLYDLARAKVDKIKSTGNGFRSYYSAAEIMPSNLVIKKGNKDLIKEVDNGMLLYGALNVHSIDFVSGDFSIGACPAFMIRKGELIGAPKKMLLSGNVYDVLRNVKEVGSDQAQVTGGLFGGVNIATPSVLSKCLIIGE